MVQQDLYNPDMTISGCTVQRSQLILEKERIVNDLVNDASN